MLPTVSGAEKGSKVPKRGARIPHVRRHFYFGTECRARIINFARNGLIRIFLHFARLAMPLTQWQYLDKTTAEALGLCMMP